MRKSLETSLVLLIALFTVSASASVIHDLSAGKQDVVLVGLKRGLQHVVAGLQGKSAASVVVNHSALPAASDGASSTQQLKPAHTTTAKVGNSISLPNGVTWTGNDVGILKSIVQKLWDSVSPTQWKLLLKDALAHDNRQLDTALTQVINRDMSPSDQAWIRNHFPGPSSFGSDDVVLLEQTLQQVRYEMTPYEQSLINQDVVKWVDGLAPSTTK